MMEGKTIDGININSVLLPIKKVDYIAHFSPHILNLWNSTTIILTKFLFWF